MDIEPHGDPEIAFNMNTIEAMALEDIGFLKRVTSQEKSLEFHGATFTFWKEYIDAGPRHGSDEELFWNTRDSRAAVLDDIKAITTGRLRDAKALRRDIRMDRLLLTSRGYELAAILFDDFYEMLKLNDLSSSQR